MGAIAWLLGLPLIAIADVPFPTDTGYLLTGVTGLVLGCAIGSAALGVEWGHAAVRVTGLALGMVLAVTSAFLAFASRVDPGEGLLQSIQFAASAMLFSSLVWMVAATVASRQRIGTVATRLGLLLGASLLATVATEAWMAITNTTLVFVIALFGLLWFCPAAWLLVVVWRRPEAAS